MRTRFPRLGLTGRPRDRRAPRAVADGDRRFTAQGGAEAVLGTYLRTNIRLQPAATPYPTALVEYRVPHLVLSQPGPAILAFWNRVQLFSFEPEEDPEADVPPGDFWAYRATLADGSAEQRIRLGRAPDPGDVVFALFYIIDYGVAA